MNRTYGFEGEAKHKHGEQSYKVCANFDYSQMRLTVLVQLFAHVFTTMPLATLISGTKPPVGKEAENAIVTDAGTKRYYVVHGGLFSKDGVTLDEIRKIQRIGNQPGTSGLMCE